MSTANRVTVGTGPARPDQVRAGHRLLGINDEPMGTLDSCPGLLVEYVTPVDEYTVAITVWCGSAMVELRMDPETAVRIWGDRPLPEAQPPPHELAPAQASGQHDPTPQHQEEDR